MAQPGYTHQRYPLWLHHPEHPSVLVHDEDAEAAKLAEWNVKKEDNDLKVDAYRYQLTERANKAGVKLDARWSDKRLEQEVLKAEANDPV